MNQQQFKQTINSGKPFNITNEMMAAARESALSHRNEAMISASRWIRNQFCSIFGINQEKPAHCHN